MNDIRDPRHRLRQKMLEKRRSLSPSQIENLSERTCQRAKSWIEGFTNNKPLKIGFYRAFSHELSLGFLETVWTSRYDLFYPRVYSLSPPSMDFYRVENPATQVWEKSALDLGIEEPPITNVPGSLDVIIIPALAFDTKGMRLGYGKGFYDLFLNTQLSALRIGVAFDFQLVDNIPHEPWDVPMHHIFTDRRSVHKI